MPSIMRFRRLSTKVISIVLLILLISFIGVIIYQYGIVKDTHFMKEIDRSRALTTFCEQVRVFTGDLRLMGTFDDEKLIRELKADLAAGKSYQETRLYPTIPVVSAWTAAEAKADMLGYKFRVPKNQARNPKNEPRPGIEEAVVNYLEGKGELEDIEKAGGEIVYPSDKTIAREIGEIGVLHIGEETMNAAEGGRTENFDAIRFFRAIKLTEDCLSCHGFPIGEPDIIGFEKEGWKVGEIHGAFEIISPLEGMRGELSTGIRDNIIMALALFLVSGMVFFLFLRRVVSNPIKKIVALTQKLGNGDFTDDVVVDNNDEIGEMAAHLNTSVGNLRKIIKRLNDLAFTLKYSSGELAAVSGEMAASSDELSSQSSMVADAAQNISSNISDVAASAEQSGSGADNIAAMAEEMSANVAEVAGLSNRTSERVKDMKDSGDEMNARISNIAAAVEEMTASLGEVSKNTAKASVTAKQANQNADDINVKMNALSQSSQQIGKIVGIIKSIADQTNMLALNATIEAAGAGEAGKGFAVVAGEVKELAKQSADATDEISGKIEHIQAGTDDAVHSIQEINKIISENALINESIAASVEQQSSTADEISRNIAESAEMVKNVSDLLGESSDLISDIAKATNETNVASSEVAKNIAEITHAVKSIASSAVVATNAAEDINDSIMSVTSAVKDIASGADVTNKAAVDLSGRSTILTEVIGLFDTGEEKFDIVNVKNAHLQWRSKLDKFINGSLSLTVDEVASHKECDFGKWYYGEEAKKYATDPIFIEIGKHHQDVHVNAEKIVSLLNRGKKEDAKECMERFETAVKELFKNLEEFYIN